MRTLRPVDGMGVEAIVDAIQVSWEVWSWTDGEMVVSVWM